MEKQNKNVLLLQSVWPPADDVVRLVQLLLLGPPWPGSPADGRRAAAGGLGGGGGEGRRDGAAAGGHGAVVERAERVVPAAQPRLVLERLHRRHARRHH